MSNLREAAQQALEALDGPRRHRTGGGERMSKHTPGPWTANKPTQSNGRAEVHAGPMLVAQAFNWLLDAEGDEQCWADARLIATAPELLEALKSAERAMSNKRFAAEVLEHDSVVREMIRAAIARAEGQA